MNEFVVPAVVTPDPDANTTDLLVDRVAQAPGDALFALPTADGGWKDVSAEEFHRQVVALAKGFIAAKKVAVSAAGHTSVVMETAGVRLPLESYPLQALVSEPVKPIFPCVVMSNSVHAYLSQSDKGELVIGSGTDQYVSYSQRGGLPLIEHTLAAICEIFPMFRRMRMLRKWGGIVDVTPDRSAILGKTPVPGLYVNCGWGTGGFKATPGAAHVLAWTVAKDEPHPINAPFTLERFTTGRLIDEAAAAAVAH